MFVLIFILIYINDYLSSFLIKINDVLNINKNSNLSALVYMYGWEIAYSNLIASNGLGLGFNLMGCEPSPVTISSTYLWEMGRVTEDLKIVNYNDGSFLASKIISEFGIFGIIILIYQFFLLYKIKYYTIRLIPEHSFYLNLMLSYFSALIVSEFFRGTGYFSTVVLFALVLLVGFFKSIQEAKLN
jgi:hypothetical protein